MWTIGAWIGWIIAYIFTFLFSIPCFARILPCTYDCHMYLIWANMYTLWIYLPVYIILIISIIFYNISLIIWSGFICLCHIIWILPDFQFAHKSSKQNIAEPTTRITIFTSNLLMVNQNTNGICQEILNYDADILMLQEYSKIWDDSFQIFGIIKKYKYCIKHVRNDSFGTAIYSKLPFVYKPELWWIDDIPFTEALIKVNDNKYLKVYNLHPLPPRLNEYMNVFNSQLNAIYERIKRENEETNHGLLVAGDFNNTQHNFWVKKFDSIKNMKSAHKLCGRGYAITFPNGIFPVPPIRLDHCFVNNKLNLYNISEGEGMGSDHLPLIIDIGV